MSRTAGRSLGALNTARRPRRTTRQHAMTAPEKLADRLHGIYIGELSRALRGPAAQALHATHARAMIHRARTTPPIVHEEPEERTWIWSDLHLGHDFSIGAFSRPFDSARSADKAMQRAWNACAAEGDTTVCAWET